MDCNQVVFEIQKLNDIKVLTNIFMYLLWSVLAHIPFLLSMLISPFPLHLRRLNIHSIPLFAIIMKHHITQLYQTWFELSSCIFKFNKNSDNFIEYMIALYMRRVQL